MLFPEALPAVTTHVRYSAVITVSHCLQGGGGGKLPFVPLVAAVGLAVVGLVLADRSP